MDVFEIRERLVTEYETYIKSFVSIKDKRIQKGVDDALQDGSL